MLGADGIGVVAHVRQRTRAGGAGIRIVIAHMVDVSGVRLGTVMLRMAKLGPRRPHPARVPRRRTADRMIEAWTTSGNAG